MRFNFCKQLTLRILHLSAERSLLAPKRIGSYISTRAFHKTCGLSMSAVKIKAQPHCGLVDDPLLVQVVGLQPHQPVTIAAVLKEKKLTYTSYAYYQADIKGCVDLSTDPASGGSYQGLEPEGILWSMVPAPDQRKGVRIMKDDVTIPFRIRVSVLPEHLQANTAEHHSKEQVLCHVDLERFYMASWVKREKIRQGRIRGTLFYPNKDSARFPGIVDLYGTAGGLNEYRAALLASHGFTVLALAYFAYDDLPDAMLGFQMEYFEEAVDWLSDHMRVAHGGVATVGISKGAEIAMQIPIHCTKVKATVSISGSHFNCLCPTTYKGQEIPAIDLELGAEFTEEGVKCKSWPEGDNIDDCIIPIEQASQTQFLFIHGTDDLMSHPRHCLSMADRLRQAGLDNYELHIYPKAGHLLEPPYTPFCRTPWHKVYKHYVLYGGYLEPHARAQADMWPHVISFLKRNLPSPEGVDVGNIDFANSTQKLNSTPKSHL